jgi:hypothetical protein
MRKSIIQYFIYKQKAMDSTLQESPWDEWMDGSVQNTIQNSEHDLLAFTKWSAKHSP